MKKVKVNDSGSLPDFVDGNKENQENYYGEIRDEDESSYLLYNPNWYGHDGCKGDLSDVHYWWVGKEYCVDVEEDVETTTVQEQVGVSTEELAKALVEARYKSSCEDLLNKKGKDRVTGMVGTITAHCVWLTGPHRVYLEGIDNTGRPIGEWFDEERIQVL